MRRLLCSFIEKAYACTGDAAKADKANMEARPPAAGFFACKEPREETTRASALDPGPRGGAVQVACKT